MKVDPPVIDERFRKNFHAFHEASERYWKDSDLRSRVDTGDVKGLLGDLGIELPSEMDAKVAANTSETYHVVFPADPNTELTDEMLSGLAGGGEGGFVASSCYSCWSSPCFG